MFGVARGVEIRCVVWNEAEIGVRAQLRGLNVFELEKENLSVCTAVYEFSSHFHLPYLGFFFSLIKSRSMSCFRRFFCLHDFPLSLWLSFFYLTHGFECSRKQRYTRRTTHMSFEGAQQSRTHAPHREGPESREEKEKKLPNLVSSSQAPCSGRFEFCDDKLLARICTNGKIWMEKCYNSLARSSLSENFYFFFFFLRAEKKSSEMNVTSEARASEQRREEKRSKHMKTMRKI